MINADVLGPADGRVRWQVLVRITSKSTGQQVDVVTVGADTATSACRAAGYTTAALVLARSSRVAEWARWDKATAEAWAAYDQPQDVPLPELEAAVRRAPNSGLLLQRLAQAYDMQGRFREALSLYARAVSAHPRYPAARYRLAISLCLLADKEQVERQWQRVPVSERQRITGQLKRAFRSDRREHR